MGSTTVCVNVLIDRESTAVEVDDLSPVTAPHRLNDAGLESLERIRRQGGTADSYGQALFDLAFDDDARYGFMAAMRPFQPGRSTGQFRLRLELAASAPAASTESAGSRWWTARCSHDPWLAAIRAASTDA